MIVANVAIGVAVHFDRDRADSQARPVSPTRCYRRPMIDLGSIAGLHEHRHELAAYCPPVASTR